MATTTNTTIALSSDPAVDRSAEMFAHYCSNKTVRVTNSMRPVGGDVIAVSGKREARRRTTHKRQGVRVCRS